MKPTSRPQNRPKGPDHDYVVRVVANHLLRPEVRYEVVEGFVYLLKLNGVLISAKGEGLEFTGDTNSARLLSRQGGCAVERIAGEGQTAMLPDRAFH